MTTLSAPPHAPPLGAHPHPNGTTFRVWSTTARTVHVLLDPEGPQPQRHALHPSDGGVFEATLPDVHAGARYLFELDGARVPDPYARWLPDGVHAPGVVWRSSYVFQHPAPTLTPDDLAIYELHVGTFTPEGTYAAARAKLPYLRDLGVTCIELLPLAAFPGARGWGYDGVTPFAPFAPYGPPEDLQAFVDDAHAHGLHVILDVVYNHLGPDGNYLGAYSPDYFSTQQTPWGQALNYGQPFMRQLVLDNVTHWLRTYNLDGFRLDATHEIHDTAQPHILTALAAHVQALGAERERTYWLWCEDGRANVNLPEAHGMTGMWADAFHHQLRVLLTGEREAYYAAYAPRVADLARCIRERWLHGRHAPATAGTLPTFSFVCFIQNHDHIGNRPHGDRLQCTAGEDGFLAASALLLCLPMTPLLFQGQEWMASTPFLYFSDHHGELGRAVTLGRQREFAQFGAFRTPGAARHLPDPQAERTFTRSKLDWTEGVQGTPARVLDLYRTLLHLRRTDPVLRHAERTQFEVGHHGDLLWVQRWHGAQGRTLLVNFGTTDAAWAATFPALAAQARPLQSTAPTSTGLPPRSALLLAHPWTPALRMPGVRS